MITLSSQTKITIIGLGYVGLPLAVEFAKRYTLIGFDTNEGRIEELQKGYDRTQEIDRETLINITQLQFTTSISTIADSTVYIVTVPTPIDAFKKPDLTALLSASQIIGSVLKPNDVVIYESTVYPGCTEEKCVPILEKESGLKLNTDFFVGYSPERINPGDKVNTLPTIKKVTSGSTPIAADFIDQLYQSIITAGTYKTSSIKVAEAAKAIENSQRDVNISFVNELALIFDRMDIDTTEVLEAAATKWNFLNFKPGLVGGHCIGVDPYYLTHKAESLGYSPQVILSGRRVNDHMGIFVANKLVKLLIKKGHPIEGSKVVLLGITFKENCPDMRNSRVVDVYRELTDFGIEVDIYDPWVDEDQVMNELGIKPIVAITDHYHGVVVAVAHEQFKHINFDDITLPNSVIYDLKSIIPKEKVDARL